MQLLYYIYNVLDDEIPGVAVGLSLVTKTNTKMVIISINLYFTNERKLLLHSTHISLTSKIFSIFF